MAVADFGGLMRRQPLRGKERKRRERPPDGIESGILGVPLSSFY